MTHPRPRNFYSIVSVGLAALVSAFSASAAAADQVTTGRAPAGQVCPSGSFVTGFDDQGNIICGEIGSRGTAAPEEPADATVAAAAAAAVAAPSVVPAESGTQTPSDRDATPALAIGKVTPWSVPYGKPEVTLEISGTGFTADSVVIFQGERYVPSVDQTGTRLDVTIATRHLTMGAYPLTVSNGPETKATLKKALVVY